MQIYFNYLMLELLQGVLLLLDISDYYFLVLEIICLNLSASYTNNSAHEHIVNSLPCNGIKSGCGMQWYLRKTMLRNFHE